MTKKGMSREQTLELLGITDDLPTLPDRFLKIQHVINDPNSSMSDIAKIIETDQATAVMVMKVANSPAYSTMGNSASTLSQAIARLGTTETANIALSMSLLYGFAIPAGIAIIRTFWTHAYAVGLLCKHLTEKLPEDTTLPNPETMFLAGLLHDIGKAILGTRIDLSYFERSEFRSFGTPLIDAETASFGINHAEVGQLVLSRWGMPDEVIQTVSGHYGETQHQGSLICHMADLFANEKLSDFSSIEGVHIALLNGLFDEAESMLVEKGLLPPPEADEQEES